jgi:gliding motility-associated-like protein
VEVIALPEAEIVASADALCPGDSLTLEASGHFSRITWEDGSTDAMRTVGTPGTYQLSAYNDEGCEIVREVTITEAETPLLSIESEGSLQIIRGDSVRLMAFGAETYTWSPAAGLSDSTSASTYASPLQTTTYTLSGWSAEGCSSSVTVTVEVTLDQMRIEPRPVFSPNQDGIEDNWQVEGIELYPDCHFLIFDIQGREVYRSAEDYLNDWQGTDLQGSPLPEGVYYYVFRCSDSRNRKTGSVTLVR